MSRGNGWVVGVGVGKEGRIGRLPWGIVTMLNGLAVMRQSRLNITQARLLSGSAIVMPAQGVCVGGVVERRAASSMNAHRRLQGMAGRPGAAQCQVVAGGAGGWGKAGGGRQAGRTGRRGRRAPRAAVEC